MKQLLTFLFAFSVSLLNAQEKTERPWYLKTNLVSYLPNLNFYTGKANLELELPLRRAETSAAFGLGYIYSFGSTHYYDFLSIEQTRTTGYSISGEHRWYLGKRRVFEPLCLLIWPLATQINNTGENYSGLYVSGQGSMTHQWIRMEERRGERLPNTLTLTNVIPRFLMRLGFQSISPNSVVVDQSLGIGFQYLYVTSPGFTSIPFFYTLGAQTPNFFWSINYSLKIGIAGPRRFLHGEARETKPHS